MGKAPAFQLYATDFYVDTAGWTATEVGAYIRLLLHQWAEGPLPDDLNILARIAGVDRKTMGKFWLSCVGKKFVKNAIGTWENSRLEQTRKAQLNYIELQRVSGKEGAEKRWNKDRLPQENPNGENMALHLLSSSSSVKHKKVYTYPTISEVEEYCKERGNDVDPQKWINHYTANGWMIGKNRMKDWKAAVRTWESHSGNGTGKKLDAIEMFKKRMDNANPTITE